MLDLVERIDAATTVVEAAETLLADMRALGALSLMADHTRVTMQTPGVRRAHTSLAALTPAGWKGSSNAAFVDRYNPNPAAARNLRRPFRWRQAALPTPALAESYWEALGEFGAVDGFAVPVYGPTHLLGVSMAFATNDWSPRERRTMEFACYAFVDKMRALAPDDAEPPRLSPRERDCLSFVAEGKTDWEISVILGVSQHTSHQYVESARKKLGAMTRAQAVARFVLLGLL
ncbi:MAG: autoinducer binding domain-containing protein [Alphaproteobacteria bacterium]|nr:autoinducer binding domain-containing protein [Alphaproteobacteria bacterium]